MNSNEQSSEQFRLDMERLLPVYFSNPEINVTDLSFNDGNGQTIAPHVAFPNHFQHWVQTEVQSPWEKLRIIFAALDQVFWKQLDLWQMMERSTIDRMSTKALEFATHADDAQKEKADFWYALGHAQFLHDRSEDAEKSLLTCLKINPQHKKGRIVYADLQHCTQRHEEAHTTYMAILKEGILPDDQKKDVSLKDIFKFHGHCHSPVFAVGDIHGRDSTTNETWDWMASDFYYSPYFRFHHAVFLLKNNNDDRSKISGFTKLLFLAKEMPWYQEGVVNAYTVMNQLGMNDQFPEDRVWLKKTIDEHNWSLS